MRPASATARFRRRVSGCHTAILFCTGSNGWDQTGHSIFFRHCRSCDARIGGIAGALCLAGVPDDLMGLIGQRAGFFGASCVFPRPGNAAAALGTASGASDLQPEIGHPIPRGPRRERSAQTCGAARSRAALPLPVGEWSGYRPSGIDPFARMRGCAAQTRAPGPPRRLALRSRCLIVWFVVPERAEGASRATSGTPRWACPGRSTRRPARHRSAAGQAA